MRRSIRVGLMFLLCATGSCANEPGGPVFPQTSPSPEDLVEPVAARTFDSLVADGLSKPLGLTVSANDDVCVADTGNARLVLLDADLELIGTIGRRGQGPGEFERVVACSVERDGSVFALDTGTGRLTAFSADGDATSSTQISFPVFPQSVFAVAGLLVSPADNLAGLEVHTATELVARVEGLGATCIPDTDVGVLPSVRIGVSPDGSTAVVATGVPCIDRPDLTRLFLIDLAGLKVSSTHDVAVQHPDANAGTDQGGGRTRFTQSVGAVASRAGMVVALHAGAHPHQGRSATALDLFGPSAGEPKRRYLTAEGKGLLVPNNLIGITSTGDVIVVDPINELILKFAAERLWPTASG